MRRNVNTQNQRSRVRQVLVALAIIALASVAVFPTRAVLAVAGRNVGEATRLFAAFDGPAGPPVATLGTDLSLLENTHMIIKLDGFDPNPGVVLTAHIIYISNAGTLFQVNPDGTRGTLIGDVTPELGVQVTNSRQFVWYEPNTNFFGTDGFQYYLSDNLGGESSLRTTTIHVNRLSQAPVAFSATHSGPVASPTGIVLDWSDPDPFATVTGHITQFPNSGRLYRSISATPADQLTPANPTFTGTQLYYVSDDFPNPSTDAFSYYVSDGTLSSQVVTDYIDLEAVDSPPTTGTTPSIFATTENTPLQIVLNPVDPAGQTSSLQIELTDGPQNGGLCQLNLLNVCQPVTPGNDLIGPEPDGKSWAITYTPNEGFTTDGGSPDTFTYTLTSAEGITSGPFTVQIYVLGITNPADCSAVSISPATVPGGNLNSAYPSVSFGAAGGSVPYAFSEIGTLPAGMTFTDGVLSGTPSEAGPFSFVVVATDSNGCTSTAAYQFEIMNPPPGISAAGPLSVIADGTASLMTVATVTDSALSPATLSVHAAGAPAGINVAGFKNANGTITAYVGASCGTAPGPYSVTLEVTDGTTTAMANLAINVTAPPTPVVGLSYPSQIMLVEGQSTVVNPQTALTSGITTGAVAFNNGAGGYDGTISVNSSGVVTIGNAGPSGSAFTVDVTVLLPCGTTKDVTFTFVVSCSADSFSLSAPSSSIPKGGGAGTVEVFAPGMCSWTAVSNAPWIIITSGASGLSDGAVGFSVSPTTVLRSGTLTIAGQTFTVNQDCPAPTVGTQPTDQTVCVGSKATFSIAASGSNLTYQWRKNGAPISGAHSRTFAIASVTSNDAGQYDVIVSGDCGSVTSGKATLTISSPLFASQPSNQSAFVGGSAAFSITVKSLVSYTVQWQVSGGNSGFTNIPGATSTTLTLSGITAAENGNSYRAVITSGCGTTTSNQASLFVF